MAKIKKYPWLPGAAVGFLMEWLKPHMYALEFGAGSSTIWIGNRVEKLISIEHDPVWHDEVRNHLNGQNVELIQHDRPYYNIPIEGKFDFILIDGRDRVKCFKKARKYLKIGGVIMLDNSERKEYKRCFKLGEGWPFFTAFGPDFEGDFDYPDWSCTWWVKTY